ncbi:hypothetical protein GDO78_022352 [Eleutherodactylus coqui]|uniref:Uncharacterized protein n=1 Tax=Eleutherodactylus coqui TaxID=57060 RepID=A0A8J6BDV0_ELECQ|nr:hypothetical protein GDO78_022352 [Eleutherodactylus coqui]
MTAASLSKSSPSCSMGLRFMAAPRAHKGYWNSFYHYFAVSLLIIPLDDTTWACHSASCQDPLSQGGERGYSGGIDPIFGFF